MEWSIVAQDPLFAAYVDWELTAARARKKGEILLPAYVRLNLKPGADADTVIQALNELHGAVQISNHELDLLRTEIEAGVTANSEVNLVVYGRPDALQNDLWTVLHVGAPVLTPPEPLPPYSGVALSPGSAGLARRPIVAVIDDAIGYLNARFRSTINHARFEAVWIMGQPKPVGPVPPASGVFVGAILEKVDIASDLATGWTEASLYHRRNEALFVPEDHKATNLKTGHGTCVLDRAAGDEPGAPLSSVPLLAVQLPPAAIVATSGRRLEHLVIEGLRWVMVRALAVASSPAFGGMRPPLIVDLSLGTLAGPRDKTELLARVIPIEIERFRLLSGGTPMRVVAAYGNAYREKLCAKARVLPGTELALDWRILPDDRTASYLEVRVPPGLGKHIRLTLTPPRGIPALVLPAFLTPAQKAIYEAGGELLAGVYRLSEANQDVLLVVVAATETFGVGVAAPPGAWGIGLANGSAQAIDISVQVRRDDTPDGYRIQGRQSWLDHAEAWNWDAETMDWTRPDSLAPIRREDTAVSFCAMDDRSFYLVGAAMPDRAVSNGVKPALYAAQGEPARKTGPDLSALAEDGRVAAGRAASGILSGSRTRLSGSSIAAPLVTRALVQLVLSGGPLPARPNTDDRNRELAGLLAIPVTSLPAYPDSRRGKGMLPD